MSTKILRLVLMLGVLSGHIIARDLPVFYRAPLLDGQPSTDVDDWHTTFSISYLQGGTDRAWRGDTKKRALFDAWGVLDVTKLGKGVQDKTATLSTYWNNSGSGIFDKLVVTGDDGKLSISGRSEVKELFFQVQQNLFAGINLYAYVPIRSIKNKHIASKYLGTNPTVEAFLNGDDFATILTEYGYKPLTSTYSKSEISDVLLGIGWQGIDTTSFQIIDSLSGGGEVGIVFPCGARSKNSYVAAVPTGYDGYWSVKAQIEGEAGFWKYCALGAATSATIFFPMELTMRMKTDKEQSGVIVLDKGFARGDPGAMWGVSVYAKATAPEAFFALVGVSFIRQEKMQLEVRDDHFLNRVIQETNQGRNAFVSRDDIANADERLQAWHMYTIHLKATYDMRKKTASVFAPAISVEYACPFSCAHVFNNDIVSGTLGANFQWQF